MACVGLVWLYESWGDDGVFRGENGWMDLAEKKLGDQWGKRSLETIMCVEP